MTVSRDNRDRHNNDTTSVGCSLGVLCDLNHQSMHRSTSSEAGMTLTCGVDDVDEGEVVGGGSRVPPLLNGDARRLVSGIRLEGLRHARAAVYVGRGVVRDFGLGGSHILATVLMEHCGGRW